MDKQKALSRWKGCLATKVKLLILKNWNMKQGNGLRIWRKYPPQDDTWTPWAEKESFIIYPTLGNLQICQEPPRNKEQSWVGWVSRENRCFLGL